MECLLQKPCCLSVKIAYQSKWFMLLEYTKLQCVRGFYNISMLRRWDDNLMQGTGLPS